MKNMRFGIRLVPDNQSRIGYCEDNKLHFSSEFDFEYFNIINNFKHEPICIIVYILKELDLPINGNQVLCTNLVGGNPTIETGLVRSPSKYYEIIASSNPLYSKYMIDDESIKRIVEQNGNFTYNDSIMFRNNIATLDIISSKKDSSNIEDFYNNLIEIVSKDYKIPKKYLINDSYDNREFKPKFIEEFHELLNKHQQEIDNLIKKYEK